MKGDESGEVRKGGRRRGRGRERQDVVRGFPEGGTHSTAPGH